MSLLSFKNLELVVDHSTILNNVTFDVQKGDCISIVGPSGSGKSTLLKTIADLISVSKGELYYKGEDYNTYEPEKLRQEIAYCVQTPYLFGSTVVDNFNFVYDIRKLKPDHSRMIELLECFKLDQTYLTKDIHSLSGGEKQRISLIRSLLILPKVLLLDEVTSALDTVNAKVVVNYIQMLNHSGITVLWITHDVNQSTSIFNKRLTLVSGSIEKEEVLG